MSKFIVKMNTERFREQLLVETDPERIATLRKLLKAEEAKLRLLAD